MRESMSPVRLSLLLFGIAAMIPPSTGASAVQVGIVKDLEANWKSAYNPFRDYMHGAMKPEDKKLAEKAAQSFAQYHIYRITHRNLDAFKVQKDLADMIATGDKRDNKDFVNILGPKMVEAMKEVLLAQDPKKDAIVVVNAAIMLPALAKLKQEDVGTYLVELVNGTDTPDYVRLYAVKALKEYMPITVQQPLLALEFGKGKQSDKRARDQKYIDPLTKYIEQPFKVGGLTRGEIEGVRFIRREAIISLGQAGSPAVLAVPEKDGKMKSPAGMVAPTLLKVLAKGELQPPPSMQEKVEAAVGLLKMNYPNMPEYNPDVATYLVGKMLVEFATEYNTDLTNFGAGKKLALVPWKDDARRLQDAIKENAKRNPENKSARELKAYAESSKTDKCFLDKIIAHDSVVVIQLTGQVEQWRPKDGKVFKTLAAPEIRFGAAVDPD